MSAARAVKRRRLTGEHGDEQQEQQRQQGQQQQQHHHHHHQEHPPLPHHDHHHHRHHHQSPVQATSGETPAPPRTGAAASTVTPASAAKSGVDVYFDAKRERFKRAAPQPNGTSRSRSARASATSPPTKSLDPLRNQKAPVPTSPAPAARPSFGFFKQFHGPPAAGSGTAAVRRAPPAEADNHGHPGPEAAEDDSEDELVAPDTPSRKTPSQKTPSQETPSQKTPSQPTPRRPPATRPRVAGSPAPTPVKPLDRRKSPHAQPVGGVDVPESDAEHRMEVDQSESEHLAREHGPPAQRSHAQPSVAPQKTTRRLTNTSAAPAAGPRFSHQQARRMQRVLMEKAIGKRPMPLVDLDNELAKVSSLIEQTVTAGESNSMLVVGARGCGKTALVAHILRQHAVTHAADFHVVRLNGFIHTDDKMALREIWRQLGREMELDEDERTSTNHADTMARLLALLSHPTDVGLEPDRVTNSVIFVLDEFDLFAGHPRQTLLYNLFDIAQSRKAPIAVLGLTTRIDVADSLEKRVKSRFSHRYVHLSLAKSLASFQQICRGPLTLTAQDWSSSSEEEEEEGNAPLEQPDGTADKIAHASPDVPSSSSSSSSSPSSSSSGPIAAWNAVVEQILASESCSSCIRRIYHTTKAAPDFFAALTLGAAKMPTDSPTARELLDHFTAALAPSPSLLPPDSKLTLLPSLSTLQLALLICAARLANIYSIDVVSFALVYEEYKLLASKARLQASASGAIATTKVWAKDVARAAWTDLIHAGLVMADGRTGGATGRVDVALEEIGMSPIDLGAWGKWCKEI